MAAQHTDFNYLSLLRNLERSITGPKTSGYPRNNADKNVLSRAVAATQNGIRHLRASLAKLEPKRLRERQLSANLKGSFESYRRTELTLIRNIEERAKGFQPGHAFLLSGWPPTIPVEMMVSRFAALTIGMQSESSQEPQLRLLAKSVWLDTVAPALAWGIRTQSGDGDRNQDDRRQLAHKIRHGVLSVDPTSASTQDSPYLRLAEAWFNVLPRPAGGGLDDQDLHSLRIHLSELIEHADLREIWATLGDQYSPLIVGTDRAKAVNLASQRLPNDETKAAFIRDRLVMLKAAKQDNVKAFAELTKQNRIEEALREAQEWKDTQYVARKGDDLRVKSCGFAFWLAKLLYKAHDRPEKSLLDRASDMVCDLLLDVVQDIGATEEQRLLAARYRAGYATNPRYYRSQKTLNKASDFVEHYARKRGHRQGLVNLFEGRLCWQLYKTEHSSFAHERLAANYYYSAALEGLDDGSVDSEAPIHLFPEIMVVLEDQLSHKDGKLDRQNQKDLALLDYISQRTYGVYFDAPTEQQAIEAGCNQYKEWHQTLTKDEVKHLLTRHEERRRNRNKEYAAESH